MLAIIQKFQKQKIFVGDTHQAIYKFMGNINSFDIIQPTNSFCLSKSFRFGKEIADYASAILCKHKKEESVSIEGLLTIPSKIISYDKTESESWLEFSKKLVGSKQITILSRVNKTLFNSGKEGFLEPLLPLVILTSISLSIGSTWEKDSLEKQD
jgi:hypothetical protein